MAFNKWGKFYSLQRLIDESKAKELSGNIESKKILQMQTRDVPGEALSEVNKYIESLNESWKIDSDSIAGIKLIYRQIIGDERIEDVICLYGWLTPTSRYGWILFVFEDGSFDLITTMKYARPGDIQNIPIPRMYDLKQHQENGHLYGIFLTYENDNSAFGDINNQPDHVREFITLNGNTTSSSFFTFIELTNPTNHIPSQPVLDLEVIKVIEITNKDGSDQYVQDKAVHRIYGSDDNEDQYMVALVKTGDNTTYGNIALWPIDFSQEIGKTEVGYNVQQADVVRYRGKGGSGTAIEIPEKMSKTIVVNYWLNPNENFDLKTFENDSDLSDGFVWYGPQLTDTEYVWHGTDTILTQYTIDNMVPRGTVYLALTSRYNNVFDVHTYETILGPDIHKGSIEVFCMGKKFDFVDTTTFVSDPSAFAPSSGTGLSGTLKFERQLSYVEGYYQKQDFVINLSVLSDIEYEKNKKIKIDVNTKVFFKDHYHTNITGYWTIWHNIFSGNDAFNFDFSRETDHDAENFNKKTSVVMDPLASGKQTIKLNNGGLVDHLQEHKGMKLPTGTYFTYEVIGKEIHASVIVQIPVNVRYKEKTITTFNPTQGPDPDVPQNTPPREVTNNRSSDLLATNGSVSIDTTINGLDWEHGNTKQWIYNVRKTDAEGVNQDVPIPELVRSTRAPNVLFQPEILSPTSFDCLLGEENEIRYEEFNLTKNNEDALVASRWEGDRIPLTNRSNLPIFGHVKLLSFNKNAFVWYHNTDKLVVAKYNKVTKRLYCQSDTFTGKQPIYNYISSKFSLLSGVHLGKWSTLQIISLLTDGSNLVTRQLSDEAFNLTNNYQLFNVGPFNALKYVVNTVNNESGFNMSAFVEEEQIVDYKFIDYINIVNSDGQTVVESLVDTQKEIFNAIDINYTFNYDVLIRNAQSVDNILSDVNEKMFENNSRGNFIFEYLNKTISPEITWLDDGLLLSFEDDGIPEGTEITLKYNSKKVMLFAYNINKYSNLGKINVKVYWEEV